MKNTETNVGFIGLGNMGLPMAENIQKKGLSLIVHNRTRQKAESILKLGAKWADTPRELAEMSDIVVSMVANDDALSDIVNGTSGIISATKKPLLHISMSTVSPMLSDSLEKKHKDHGIAFIAAPVTGRPDRAKSGTLWIFVSGDDSAKKAATPVLQSMSSKIFDLGDKPSQASIFKLCNNFMILSLIESFSEAASMLEKNGISTEKAAEVFGNSLFDAPVFHSYTPLFCKQNFADGGFALELGLKDIRLLHTASSQSQVPMPFLSDLQEKLLISMNLGREKYDWSAIFLLAREQAGFKD